MNWEITRFIISLLLGGSKILEILIVLLIILFWIIFFCFLRHFKMLEILLSNIGTVTTKYKHPLIGEKLDLIKDSYFLNNDKNTVFFVTTDDCKYCSSIENEIKQTINDYNLNILHLTFNPNLQNTETGIQFIREENKYLKLEYDINLLAKYQLDTFPSYGLITNEGYVSQITHNFEVLNNLLRNM